MILVTMSYTIMITYIRKKGSMRNEFPWKKTHKKFGLEKSDTEKISFYWPMHFYLINKKTSMDQLKKHRPYILVCAFYFGDGQTREKKTIKGKSLEFPWLNICWAHGKKDNSPKGTCNLVSRLSFFLLFHLSFVLYLIHLLHLT